MEGWINIFCEGKVDLFFLGDMISILYSYNYEKDKKGERVTLSFPTEKIKIIEVGGIGNLKDPIFYSQIEDNTKMKGKNFVFFDADCSVKKNGNKGFENCNRKLNEFKQSKNLIFEHYIWPNHKLDGKIEDLLLKLIPKDKQCIMECITNHQSCIKGTGLEDVKFTFDLKDLISLYIYTCNEKTNNELRDYKKTNLWSIDFEEIQELVQLKSFFDSHFLTFRDKILK